MTSLLQKLASNVPLFALTGVLSMSSGCALVDTITQGTPLVTQGYAPAPVQQQQPAPVQLKRQLFTAATYETSPSRATNVRSTISQDEPLLIAARDCGLNAFLRLEVYNSKGTKVRENINDCRNRPNFHAGGVWLSVSPYELPPGLYEFSIYNEQGFLDKASFTILEKAK